MAGAAETFDFIVTGAGSAGCAVAGRLSESGKYRVLLLEAGGPDRNPWIHIPLGYTKTYTDPRVNWMFETEPEAQLNGRTLYQPRGKVLGGTSSINGMVYMRGTPSDYDNWRQRGCEGWDWENVLPFFKKAENQERGADEFHGTGGPLNVSNPVRSPLGDAMVQAAVQAGIPANDDFNGSRQEGVGYYQTTTSNRRRWSAARAYLRDARRRPNLTVATKAHATRDADRERARGRRRIPHAAGPRHGALPRRGDRIGRRLRLAAAVAIVGARPGRSAASSTASRWCATCRGRRPPARPFQHLPGVPLLAAGHDQRSGDERHAQADGRRAIRAEPLRASVERRDLCRRLRAQRPAPEQPDLQINMFGWSALERLRTGIKPHPFSAFTLSPVHLRPEGRGTVRIKSPDPLAPPAIQFNFLASDYDFQALIYGTRLEPQDRRAAGLEAVCRRGGIARPGGADAMTTSSRRSGCAASPTCTRSAPAAWGMRRTRSSIRASRCTASRAARRRRLDHAASRRAATPTRPRS